MPNYQPIAQRKEISWLWSSSSHWWKCFRKKYWKNQFNWTDHYWLIKCFACPLTFLSRHTENQPSALETKISWLWSLCSNWFRNVFGSETEKIIGIGVINAEISMFFLFEWLSFQDNPKNQPTAQRKVIYRLWSLRNDWWRSVLKLKNWKNQFNWIGLPWVIRCFACRVTFISRQTCRKINQACDNKNFPPRFQINPGGQSNGSDIMWTRMIGSQERCCPVWERNLLCIRFLSKFSHFIYYVIKRIFQCTRLFMQRIRHKKNLAIGFEFFCNESQG